MQKKAFSSRKFKGGAYTTVLSALVIFFVLMVNLVVSGLTRTKDLTGQQVYSLHDVTKEYLGSYNVPIDLYYICQIGEENKVILSTAENFAAEGRDINLIQKDPVTYPMFVYEYTGSSSTDNNSIVLVRRDDPDRFVYIEFETMCLYYISTKDYTSKELAGYNAESEIMKGLVELSDEENSIVYVATGHGEPTDIITQNGTVSTSIKDLLELNSYTVRYIDLKKKAVPQDCDALMILGAVNDFDETECTAIKDYVTSGGKVMWFLALGGEQRPNMQSLLNYYGLDMEYGLLCEGDSDRTSTSNPAFILAGYGQKNSAWQNGVGLTKLDKTRDSLSVKIVASTSDSAYLTKDTSKMTYQEGTRRGSYILLAGVSETYQGNQGRLYVFNTPWFLRNQFILSSASYANSEIFVTYLGDLCDKKTTISIPTTSAYEEALKLTTHQKNVLLIVLVGVIPGLILLAGIVMVFVRRK